MKTFILLSSILLAMYASAQDSWKITHNGKQCLQTSVESVETNSFTIKAADLKKKGLLSVQYTEAEKQKDWKRSIILFDEKDTELYRKDKNILQLQNSTLAVLSKKAKKISIYTLSLPTDPKLAAVVRVRRVHLATIIIK
jgi:negative regulator of sigma E activity